MLDDDEHGYSTGERLRALDLDDEARERLGSIVMVTRDGSKLFLYTATEAHAREAERIVRGLVEADELTAEIAVTRWHPVEESWKDPSIALPATPEEEETEFAAREGAEVREAELTGEYDWHVVVHVPGRDDAVVLAERLTVEGLPVRRRWRYLIADVVTEEGAHELADHSGPSCPATLMSGSRSTSPISFGRRSSFCRSEAPAALVPGGPLGRTSDSEDQRPFH